jgi:DNA-binding transcriptional MerR regulator
VTTRPAAERPYLSIGEVLGLLLEEFPDVTISKIRFLESQGLIVPERTSSGYRKFYDEDVELLRYILREQKEHFLPLRVIKDRLETPPEGLDRPPPRVVRTSTTPADGYAGQEDVTHGGQGAVSFDYVGRHEEDQTRDTDRDQTSDHTIAIDRTQTMSHPAAQRTLRAVEDETKHIPRRPVPPDPSDAMDRTATYSRREVVAITDCDPELVRELERFGLIQGRLVAEETIFDEQDLAICEIAKAFTEAGIDTRHLRAWKTGADREAGLFEQRVLPILRKRTPEARHEAGELLDELADLGARLRSILLMRSLWALRDGR